MKAQTKQTTWQPILVGELREKALATVIDVAQALLCDPPCVLYPGVASTPESQILHKLSLADGWPGRALLYAYGARAFPGDDDAEIAADWLAQAIGKMPQVKLGASLYGGYTGVGWAVEHLRRQVFADDTESLNDEVDAALKAHLLALRGPLDYDLISGVAGVGVYALERLPHPAAVEILELAVSLIDQAAEKDAQGARWKTPAELLPAWQREICPNGYYNLGLAHGIPGLIAFLGSVCAAGVARETAQPLLEGAVSWLLRHKLPPEKASTFTTWLTPEREHEESRVAWCYGDAGLAAALLCAGEAVGRADWAQEAVAIMRKAALRPADTVGVMDAALCHGAAGVAHIYNRFYQATGVEAFHAAAVEWFERTLELRSFAAPEGFAGFAAFHRHDDGTPVWEPSPGLLEGAAGIALALLAAVSDVSPEWDRMLLLSVPI